MRNFSRFPCLRLFPVPCSRYSLFLNNWAEVISWRSNGSNKEVICRYVDNFSLYRNSVVTYFYPLSMVHHFGKKLITFMHANFNFYTISKYFSCDTNFFQSLELYLYTTWTFFINMLSFSVQHWTYLVNMSLFLEVTQFFVGTIGNFFVTHIILVGNVTYMWIFFFFFFDRT